jgi:hypothetical protein
VFHLFRGGPDYAFILSPGCGACYPPNRPDPSARSAFPRSASMSLYRAGLRLALYLPLGVAMPHFLAATGFADVSPVFTLPLRAEATILIEPASMDPPQSGLHA